MNKNKVDPTECPYFNDETCLGQDLKSIGKSVSTTFSEWDGKSFSISDAFDFIKEHGCSFCEKSKP